MFGNANGPKIQVQISEFVIPYPPQPDGQPPSLADGMYSLKFAHAYSIILARLSFSYKCLWQDLVDSCHTI